MSTNYYVGIPFNDTVTEYMHIGKQSCGYHFIWSKAFLDFSGGSLLLTLRHFKDNIYDEYDKKVELDEFLLELLKMSGIAVRSKKQQLKEDLSLDDVRGFLELEGDFC